MNQRGSMNQRTDEIERILNASKSRKSKTANKQKKTRKINFILHRLLLLESSP